MDKTAQFKSFTISDRRSTAVVVVAVAVGAMLCCTMLHVCVFEISRIFGSWKLFRRNRAKVELHSKLTIIFTCTNGA